MAMVRNQRSRLGLERRRRRRPYMRKVNDSPSENNASTLEGFINSLPLTDQYGDRRTPVADDAVRCVLLNVDRVPEKKNQGLQKQLFHWWRREKATIAMLTEMGRYWPAVADEDQWRERTRGQFRDGIKSCLAYNIHQKRRASDGSVQHGGVGTFALEHMAHRVVDSGRDISGLGRWSWVKLKGKGRSTQTHGKMGQDESPGNLRHVIAVSAYRPNPPGVGVSTVWAQHRAHLLATQDTREPRQAFLEDLATQLQHWRHEGNEIILGIDANDDLRNGVVTKRLANLGMREVILERHQHRGTQNTFHMNKRNKPIDGIFASSGVRVIASGYFDFSEAYPSTHRALWADISVESFGDVPQDIRHKFSVRRLKTDDPRVVKRYTQFVENEYQKAGIPAQIRRLMNHLEQQNGRLTTRQIRSFEWIHRRSYEIRRKAEKRCRKLRMGAIQWSPSFQALRDKLELVRLLLQVQRGCSVSSRRVRRFIKKTGMKEPWLLGEVELLEKRACLRKEYRQVRKKAPELRYAFHEQLAQALAKTKKTKVRQERKGLIQKARQREDAARQRRARGKQHSGGLTQIEVPIGLDEEGRQKYERVDSRTLVEQGCAAENVARFNQTVVPLATPPMQDPVYTEFTGPAAKVNSEAVLEGTYELSDIADTNVRKFLEHCRYPRGFRPPPPMRVKPEENADFWKKSKEQKASDPRGLHNGHYMAATYSPLVNECDAHMRSLPLMTGYSPTAWHSILDAAIEKEPGNHKVDKMRTIQLMNSEFQANNKKIGREVMASAEQNGWLPTGQHGSRKRHQAATLALCKRILWDILRMRRAAAGWCSNNAKSCYDRIVHWVARLCLVRFGLAWNASCSSFTSLQKALHYVRTGYGDCETPYNSGLRVPFQGCGQGNGAGPCMWVVISAVLIQIMVAAGFGCEIVLPISCLLIRATCFCFVDDTDIVHAARTEDADGASLIAQMQDVVDYWVGGISATGGAVRPDKSFWCLIDHKWDSKLGRWKLKSKSEVPGELTMLGPTGQREHLQRINPSEARKTLGVMMAVDGNEREQASRLRDKVMEWANAIRCGWLKRNDVLPLLQCTVMKTIEYPMAVCTFSKRKWQEILAPAISAALPKAGICRNFPREVVFALRKFQGLGVPHPYATQVSQHIEECMRHGAAETMLGKYLRGNLECLQLELGLPLGVFQNHVDQVGHLVTDSWVTRVWHELSDLGIHLAYQGPDLTTLREEDQFLIQGFVDAGFQGDDLRWLNWCRIYLNVCTLADIASADGTEITREAWMGHRLRGRRSPYSWPRSRSPPAEKWDLWRMALSVAFGKAYNPNPRRIAVPLGKWHDDISRWEWLYSPTEDAVYGQECYIWQKFYIIYLIA